MDQGIIATVKKLYKKNLLTRLLLNEKPEGAMKFLQDLNIRDCFAMLSLAWDSVNQATLQRAWKPLLGDSGIPNNLPVFGNMQDSLCNIDADVNRLEFWTDTPIFPFEICKQVAQLLSGPDYPVEESREFLMEWLENDDNDADYGWEQLTDNDIVNLSTNDMCKPEPENEIEEKETTVFLRPAPMDITPTEAFENLMKVKTWIKSRPECSSMQLCHIEELENAISQNIAGSSESKVYSTL